MSLCYLEPAAAAATHLGAIDDQPVRLDIPVDIDAGLRLTTAGVCLEAVVNGRRQPWLTARTVGRGRMLVLNVRTFAEEDFRAAGEWLLAPRELGLAALPQPVAESLRAEMMAPLGHAFAAPSGVSLHLFERSWCAYNFHASTVEISLNGRRIELPAHGWAWGSLRQRPGTAD